MAGCSPRFHVPRSLTPLPPRPLLPLPQEVLRLYKRSLALIRSKPRPTQADFRLFIRHAFRHPALSPRDVSAVEHALRTGTRKVELLENAGVKRVGVSGPMREWWEGEKWRPAPSSLSTTTTTTTTTTTEESKEPGKKARADDNDDNDEPRAVASGQRPTGAP